MKHIGRVNIFQTAQDLINERLKVRVREVLARANDSCQIALHQLLNQVCLVEVLRRWDVHAVEVCDIAVTAEVLQQLDLAQRTLGQDLLAEDIGDLLDGYGSILDDLAGLSISNFLCCAAIRGVSTDSRPCILIRRNLPDNAVGTLSNLLLHIVLRLDDKVLVEDIELVALDVLKLINRLVECESRAESHCDNVSRAG